MLPILGGQVARRDTYSQLFKPQCIPTEALRLLPHDVQDRRDPRVGGLMCYQLRDGRTWSGLVSRTYSTTRGVLQFKRWAMVRAVSPPSVLDEDWSPPTAFSVGKEVASRLTPSPQNRA